MSNNEFYLAVEQQGNMIQERYIKNGVELKREIAYEPTLFTHAQDGFNTKYKDIYGKPCIPKKFTSMRDAKDWQMKARGIFEVLGMDDFKIAYISDVYKDEIEYDPRLVRVANCDIEVTAPEFPNAIYAKYEIDAITHYDSLDDKFYVFDLLNSNSGSVSKWNPEIAAKLDADGGDELSQEILDKVVYMPFDNERDLLLEYVRLWEEKPPVIFTGWNIEGFDIPYIMNRVKNVLGVGHMKRMSPFGKVTSKVTTDKFGNEAEVFTISGIQILDYLILYKKFSFTPQPSYKLDYISEYETGLNKLVYDGPISKLRGSNHQRYISYNIIDVYCVQAIDKKRGFINLSLSMGYYAKMNIQSVLSTVKSWDSIIFNSLKADNKVIPEVGTHIKQPFEGAYVKEPIPGAYKYVISFDVTSLYPSIIRQVNISPETIAGSFHNMQIADYVDKSAPKPSENYSCSPNGMMYSKTTQGVIPRETAKVFFQRKDWKKKMLTAKRNLEILKSL